MRTALALLLVSGSLLIGLLAPASASALVIRWSIFFQEEFAAAGCGDSDTVRVRAQRGATITSVEPKVGAPLLDDPTALSPPSTRAPRTVARVSEIRKGRRSADFTATGSDDVCSNPDRYPDGWSALLELVLNVRDRFPVYMAGADDRPRKRPRIIYFGASQRIYDLRWQSWGGRVARGRGTFPANDCIPNCAGGTITPHRVKVRLTEPSPCGPRWRYLVMRFTFPSAARPTKTKFGYLCGLGPNSP